MGKKIIYSEPAEYFPKDIRKKYKLGEFDDSDKTLTKMTIKQYDKVELKNGYRAYIVEVFGKGEAFLADIDKESETVTETIKYDEIQRVL